MVTLHIEHAISDYRLWRTAFDSFAPARRDAGVVSERISVRADDEHALVVDLDFVSVERAESFRAFLEGVVWTSPTSSPALRGSPSTAILLPAG